jgi:predicted PurR-regulated permease PerM
MSRSWIRTGRPDGEKQPVEFAPQELTGYFRPPTWLRDLGGTSWLLVGVALALVALIWILTLTQTIVAPVITATVVAAVTSPVVTWMTRHRIPRGLASALVLIAFLLIAIAVVGIVLGGITSQIDSLRGYLADAKDTLANWAHDLGVSRDTADTAKGDASSGVTDAFQALLNGVVAGLKTLSSLVIFLSFTALSLFFLLKDGPLIRRWAEAQMRMPANVAHTVFGRILESLRGYFLGVTIVAAFNGVLVGLGALILGVPLAGTIVAVTFLGAYVPYLGAWTAGAFSVLLALGGAGTDAAVGMIIIQLLANGILQQMIQPIAYGAALGIHPLAVLIVTIAGGALFGAVGLILAAPLTSAATKIAADFGAARAAEAAPAAEAPA